MLNDVTMVHGVVVGLCIMTSVVTMGHCIKVANGVTVLHIVIMVHQAKSVRRALNT